ncbi:MAG: type VI secretion system tube protein TssD [Bacteroidales bacterium]
MATNPVELKVEGFNDREVMKVSYSFNQATDVEGQMSGIPRGGLIVIQVKALNDGNPDLLKWMVSPNLAKSGSVDFNETKTGNLMKKIEFKDAYCVNFIEIWEDKVGHSEEITISCKSIAVGPVVYENKWA